MLSAYGAGVRLLALTGQRGSEVFEMTWQEIDLAAKTWTLPASRAKNGRQHSVPLSDAAIAILQELKSSNLLSLVFQPVSFSREKAKLDAANNAPLCRANS
jgi:integrase